MLEDILQMPVRKVQEPVYKMPPGLDNASYVSAAGILKYQTLVEKDPYLIMKSDQTLPGLSEHSELRNRQEQLKAERKRRNEFVDEDEEYEDEYYERTDDGGEYYDEDEDYEDGDYEDEE